MDMIQSVFSTPLTYIPVALFIAKRAAYWFNLDWDKLYLTKFENLKHRTADSLMIALAVCITIIVNFINESNTSISTLVGTDLSKYEDLIILSLTFIYLFASIFMLTDLYVNNIRAQKKIIIMFKDKPDVEYLARKGSDGSLHLTDSNSSMEDSQSQKIGRVYLDESIVLYKIKKELSTVNTFILSRINKDFDDESISLTMNSTIKNIAQFILTLIPTILWAIFADTSEYTNDLWVLIIFITASVFVLLEVASSFYIPFLIKNFDSKFIRNVFGLHPLSN